MKDFILITSLLLGVALIELGLYLIYVPAALIAGGIVVCVGAIGGTLNGDNNVSE